MSLHGMHRAASSVKRKTTASIKSVFYSSKLTFSSSKLSFSSSSRSSRKRRSSLSNSSRVDDSRHGLEVRQLPKGDIATLSTTSNPKSGDNQNFCQGSSKTNEVNDAADYGTEDEGYVTANDDDMEFEDRDSEKSGDMSDAEKCTENHISQEAKYIISGNGVHKQSPLYSGKSFQNEDHPNRQQLLELRSKIVDAEERAKKVDDAALLRFLIARGMDVPKAAEMFIKDWRWRDQFAPDGFVSEDGISRQLQAEKAFLQGVDYRGRPLMVIIGSKHYSKGRDMEEFKRFCFYCIEKVIASIPEGKDKFVTIFDLGDTKFRNLDTGATLMIAEFLQSHYPERMAQLFVVHVPSMFSTVYKVVEPAIDMRSRKKIMFLSDSEMESVLKHEIGKDCLPKAYGGDAELIPVQHAVIQQGSFPCKAVRKISKV